MSDGREAMRKWFARLVVLLLTALAFGPPMIQETAKGAWNWPPNPALDVRQKDCNSIASWGHQKADYCVFEYKYGSTSGYKFFGLIRYTWKEGGLDYYFSNVYAMDANGAPAPGHRSGQTEDPYGYLPVRGQSWEYNDTDHKTGEDLLGFQLLCLHVEFPATAVPATWQVYPAGNERPDVSFVTDPNCWRPGNNDVRTGITYAWPYSSPPTGYYFQFNIYIQSRDFGWWSCYGGTFTDTAYKNVPLW